MAGDSEKKVGITVILRDKVTAGAQKLKEGFDGARKSANDLGKSGKTAFAMIGKSVVVLNQALELGKKAYQAVVNTIGQAITASLEQRAETDKGRMAWAEMTKTIREMAGYIGDFFIPVVLGIWDAFQPTIQAAKEWLATLRETQSAGFVEWLMSFGKTMISVVAKSVVFVTRTWVLLRLAVEAYLLWVNKAYAAMIGGAAAAAGAMAALAEKVGLSGLAGALRRAQAEAGHLGGAFSDNADKSADKIQELLEDQMRLEQGVKDVEAAVSTAFGRVGPAVIKRMADTIKRNASPALDAFRAGMTSALMEWEAGLESIRGYRAEIEKGIRESLEEDRFDSILQASDDAKQKLIEDAEDAMEAQKRAAESAKTEFVDGYRTARGAATDFFSNIGNGSEGVKQAFLGLSSTLGGLAEDFIVQQFAMMAATEAAGAAQISTSAASGGAKAVEAHAGIPFVGAALGLAASAVITGLILAFAGKFQRGGIIGGDGRMGDRHMILAEQGEGVLDRETTAALAASLSGRGRSPVPRSGGASKREGGGAPVQNTFVYEQRSIVPVNSAENQRNYSDSVRPMQKRLAKLGAI